MRRKFNYGESRRRNVELVLSRRNRRAAVDIFLVKEVSIMKKTYAKPVTIKKEQNRVYSGNCGNCATPGCGKQVVGTW